MTPLPPAPKGSRPAGKTLWRSVVEAFVLEEHEAAQLREACRQADLLAELQATVDREGAVLEEEKGKRVHPAAVELPQGRITFARLLSALRLPSGEESEGRPQRRSGARGVYQLYQRPRRVS